MNTQSLRTLDAVHVWHPCTQMKDHEQLPPIVIERGEGIYLIDTDGKRYIDGISSWWVNNLGHNHPRLNNALIEQSRKIAHHIFANFTNEPATILAAKLASAAPGGLSRVFFTDNGSSAVEAALKMSFQYWQQSGFPEKVKFLSLTGAYHGETLGALSVGGCELYRQIYRPILLEGFQAKGPDCYRCAFGKHRENCNAECFSHVEKIVSKHHASIAAAIVEPLVQCAAGMRIYPPLYLQKLRALCDHFRIHYVADEIAVGFGRTGKMWANEHAGGSPDILCLSKGITGGYMPLAAVVVGEGIYRAFYDDYATLKAFLHSHSYTGNALATALAVEVLDIFEDESLIERLQPKIAHMASFRERFESLPHVGEFRQMGMIAAVELVKDRESRESFPWEERRGFQVFKKALEKGALLRPLGDVIYFLPPLVIDTEAMDRLADIAFDSIREVAGG
ncbi:MAG: adenosylmethionine--8-amino-7-oxononanoate transaminase [Syntrophobacteraceae bacterium]